MSTFFHYLWRFILALVAWLAAVVAAAFVLNTLLFSPLFSNDRPVGEDVGQIILANMQPSILYVAIRTFIAWAELAARREWLFYSLAGLLAGMGVVGFGLFLNVDPEPLGYVRGITLIAVAGIVAGSVYWLIAGRSTGRRS